jgi:threonine/homoserine/homoserine lactone efflux protein
LIWLAYGAWKTWRNFNSATSQEIPRQQSIFKAVMVNLLNPAPYLGWSLIMGPLLVKGWNIHPVNGIALLCGFYGSMMIFSILMVMLFAATRSLGSGINRIFIGISAIILLLFGIYQIVSGITTI